MISPELISITVLLLYAGATLCGTLGMSTRNPLLKRLACALVVLGFAAQTLSLLAGSHSFLPGGPSWGAYLQMPAWFLVLCGLLGWWKFRTDAPLLFTVPPALFLFLMSLPYLDVQLRLPPALNASFYTFHVGALFLSLGLMAVAFGAAILFLYLNGRLKKKAALDGFRKDFPALALLDRINAVTTMLGFPLFTLGVAAGLFWAGTVWGSAFSADPKEILTFIIWGLYAWLFHMRLSGGRGRTPARLSVCIFSLCLFSFLVVNFFMDSHHSFIKRQ